MIQFHSLNTIIDDILLEARNNNVAESEQLSRAQIEQWVIEYRAMLLKQDLDKGRNINSDYVQDINNIQLTSVDENDDPISVNDLYIKRTTVKIPDGIDFHFLDSIVSVTDEYDNLIQLKTEKRSKYQKNRRYTSRDTVCYGRNGYMYVVDTRDIQSISIRGIFEDPLDPLLGLTADDRYPIPANMVTMLKELIMTKELDIVAMSDNTNDGANDIQKNQLNERDRSKLQRSIK